jgi:ferredoxin
MLRNIRIALGLVAGLLLTFLFLDFANLLPVQWVPLAKIQLLPALLSLSLGTVAALLVLTLLFGRVYCSVICPLGIFQDAVARISGWFLRKRKRYRYHPEKRWWRYGTLTALVLSYLAGWTVLVGLLDPYSMFGRMATHLLRPLYLWSNNLLAAVLNHFEIYSIYRVDVFLLSLSSFVVALLTLALVGYMAWRWGRLWCNTVCPVGTLLGMVSRHSLFQVQFDRSKCNQCGACAFKCKASCINTSTETIDASRCVTCFNCLGVCSKKALSYAPVAPKKANAEAPDTPNSRRRFLGMLGAATVAAGTQAWAQKMHLRTNVPWKKKSPLSPPGSGSIGHLKAHCTSCHLCVAQCPSKILKPALLEYGLEGMMQPTMDFTHGFCGYDCTVCTEVCPNGALQRMDKEKKHQTQLGRVVFLKHNCVVYTDETFCGACSEHCPTQAVAMVPYKNDLTIPQTDPNLCVGCGGCEYVCPAKPSKAIYVEGLPVHGKAKAIQKEATQKVQLDDFGF